jgi:thioester reductase-like protein
MTYIHMLNLDDEATLDADIQPIGTVDFSRIPQKIFLTGATGFVAAYLLKALLKKTPAQIYALVRANSDAQGLNRIRENLAHYQLWEDEFEQRVIPVPGDLKLPRFGLSETQFNTLAETVDSIYHVGSKLSYIAQYSFLKAANVGGTQETLRLATRGKAKPYHFVSSLGILLNYTALVGGGENDDLDASKCPEVGYFQTKYVAERVVRMARDRGIPVSIHRIGLIVGDSENGHSNPDDFVARILIGCIQAGYGPDIRNAMDMTPVDYVATAIAHLSFQQDSVGKVFHLLNPEPITWSSILDVVIQKGYPLQKLPFDQWVEAIEEHEDPTTNPLHPLLPFFHIDFAGRMLGVSETAYHALGTTVTLRALEGSGISCPPVDEKLVGTFLEQFVRAGRLPSPSLAVVQGAD